MQPTGLLPPTSLTQTDWEKERFKTYILISVYIQQLGDLLWEIEEEQMPELPDDVSRSISEHPVISAVLDFNARHPTSEQIHLPSVETLHFAEKVFRECKTQFCEAKEALLCNGTDGDELVEEEDGATEDDDSDHDNDDEDEEEENEDEDAGDAEAVQSVLEAVAEKLKQAREMLGTIEAEMKAWEERVETIREAEV